MGGGLSIRSGAMFDTVAPYAIWLLHGSVGVNSRHFLPSTSVDGHVANCQPISVRGHQLFGTSARY